MLNENLLTDPSNFKARALLDAYRGEMLPSVLRRRIRKGDSGYPINVAELCDYDKPIPNQWWGTNCDRQLWDEGFRLKLKAYTFALWHWLLEYHPNEEFILSGPHAGHILGTSKPHCTRTLSRKGLILAHFSHAGARIYQVYREAQPDTVLPQRLRQRGVVLYSPSGRRHYVRNRRDFARRHGLKHDGLYRVINGEQASYQGWHL